MESTDDRLEALNCLLESAVSLIGWAAQEIVAARFEPTRPNLDLAVQAISSISDLQQKLYEKRPDLMPYHLRPNLKDSTQQVLYDVNNPIPPEIKDKLHLAEAIGFLESLLMSHNSYLIQLAENEIDKLRASQDGLGR